jgi:hypothetical protein
MTSIQARAETSTPPGAANDIASPTPLGITATRTQAPFLLPGTSEEADLRVVELGADVDDLKRQSLEAEEAYRVARRRVRQRGAGVSGLDECGLQAVQAFEAEPEVRASSISDLLNTRSDELSDAEEVAADFRLPTPGPARPGSSPDNLPSPSIVVTASVPPRLLPDTAADVSPSTAGFSTIVPSSVSLVDGPAPDPLSNPVEAETEPSRSPLRGETRSMVDTPYSFEPADVLLPGTAGNTSVPPYPVELADEPLPLFLKIWVRTNMWLVTHERVTHELVTCNARTIWCTRSATGTCKHRCVDRVFRAFRA